MAVTKVTQSFKEKLPNGGWGEEVKLSTISDLIFYSDGKNLTTKTSELSNKIDKEIQDRENAVSGEKNARETAITTLTNNLSKEIQDREKAVSDEATTRASEITRVEGLITKGLSEINETAIPNAVSVANDYADELVAPITKNIDSITEIIGDMDVIKGDPLSEAYPLTISEKIQDIDAAILSILDRLAELEK